MDKQAQVQTGAGQAPDIRAQVEALLGDEPEQVKADLERAAREAQAAVGPASVTAVSQS